MKRYYRALASLIACAALCVSAAVAQDAKPFENMFVINEDNSHFFMSRQPEKMTLEGLNAFVDQYANTEVTHLFLCVNSSRANVSNPYREAIWEPNSKGETTENLWTTNCKLLEERGLDPYTVWIERCREKKISPWVSMRMNDLHEADNTASYMHSSFWVNHPEFWRYPNTTSKNWTYRALNFKHAEVRKHATDFIKFLFERYDFDGFELDWMRFGWHLTPGHEEEEAEYLTEVVAFTRNLANEYGQKRGHKIYVAARTPAHPDAARGLGMDGVAWAKAGLIDLLIPCPFWSTSDFDIPVELWRERLEGTGVAIAPGLEFNVRSNQGANAKGCTFEQLYGFAASEKFRGTTNVYLFNWMDCDTLPIAQARYHELLENGVGDAFLRTVVREVPLTYRDTVPDGFPTGAQTPRATSVDSATSFMIPVGPKPEGDGSGLILGFAKNDGLDQASFRVTLGGVENTSVTELAPSTIPDAERALFFVLPKEAFSDGYNEFVVTQTSGEPQSVIFVSARMTPTK